jgi:hypothetical protein
VLVEVLDRQLGVLAGLHIWRDMFLVVSLTFAGGWGEVVSLEREYWSGGGGYVVLLLVDGRQKILI